MSKTSAIWKVSSEDFEKIIKESDSMIEVVRKFGLKNNGNIVTLKARIEKEGIDISHLGSQKGKNKERKSNEEIFVEHSTYSRGCLIKKIIKENLLEYKCELCGLTDEWNGKKLVLQLDHKNGISDDNRLSNLRYYCANCHAQTDTYTGKNRGKSIVPGGIELIDEKEPEKKIPNMKPINKNNIIWKIELDKLQKIIDESRNYKDVFHKLNIDNNSNNCAHLGRRIKEDNMDITNMKIYKKNLNIKHLQNATPKAIEKNTIPLEKILVENYKYKSHALKIRLVEEGYMEYKCVDCGNTGTWNGKPLTLHLDHVDGNHENNTISNLEIRCGNCHSQTDTFCRTNKDKPLHPNYKPKPESNPKPKRVAKKSYECKDCGKKITKCKTLKCVQCQHKDVRKVDRPDYDTLIKEVKEKGYLGVGRDYGVSDNTIRKWVKYYEKNT